MERKTLSSSYTNWMKYVFPSLWISGFGFGAFIVCFGLARGKYGEPPPDVMKYTFAIIWLAGTTFVLWLGLQIKRVRMDPSNLYVSKWFRDITIPITEIVNVTENRWINAHPITIHLKKATACGRSIMFIPIRRPALGKTHPVVTQLKELAGLEKGF